MSRHTPYQLDVDFYDRIKSLQNRVGGLKIADGYRDDATQQQYRDTAAQRGFNPDDWFSPAGESTHNVVSPTGDPNSLGVDLMGNLADAHTYGSSYGLWAPLRNDPWHFEPISATDPGIPYRPKLVPPDFAFTDTTPTGDRALDANTANQARARAAEAANAIPAGTPPDQLAPEVRARGIFDNGEQLPQVPQDTNKALAAPNQPGMSFPTGAAGGLEPGSGAEGSVSQSLNKTSMVQPAAVNIPGTAATVGGSGAAIVNAAMSKIGKPYSTSGRFGPNAYDCSGLVVAAMREAGMDPGGNTVSTSLQTGATTPIDLETAYNTPGALLFVWGQGGAGHVEISRGDGTTIGSARGGVQVRQARGRGWTGAGLPNGVGAGTPGRPGAIVTPSAYPQRISPEDARKDVGYQAAVFMKLASQQANKAGTALPGAQDIPVQQEPIGQPGATAPTIQEQAATARDEQLGAQVQKSQTEQDAANRFAAAAAGAPPPTPQPGNPNPVGAPVPVPQGGVPGVSAPGNQAPVAAPSPIMVEPGSSKADKAAAYAKAEATGRPVEEAPELAQLPVPDAQNPAAGAQGNFGNDPDGWIRSAMQIEGVPESEFQWIKMRMMKESSGNPSVVNNWDSNAKAGHPSKGLMQFIDSTFQKWARPGMGDVMNPIHSVVAYIRAIRGGRYKGNFRLVGEMRGGYSP